MENGEGNQINVWNGWSAPELPNFLKSLPHNIHELQVINPIDNFIMQSLKH